MGECEVSKVNLFLLLAAVFAVFILVDIVSARMLSLKRTLLRNLSLAVLCAALLLCGSLGILEIIRNADTTTSILYNAYSYLLEGNYGKAVENAEKVHSPHSDMIRLLADCWQGNYAGAFIASDDLKNGGTLNDDLAKQADRIYSLSRKMTGLEGMPLSEEEAGNELAEVGQACLALLRVSEKKEVEFLAGFRRDRMLSSGDYYTTDRQTLAEMLLETPEDEELLRFSINYYSAVNDLDAAEENAYKLLQEDRSPEHIVLYTDVIAQKLLSGADISVYDESDREIGALLEKAEQAETAAGSYEEGNPRRDETLAEALEYRIQANAVKAKRIINWLIAQAPLFGDRDGVIDLQLSRLYSAAGDDGKARKLLMDLISRKDRLREDSSVREVLEKISRVYADESASDEDITAAVNSVLQAESFLPDSVLNRGYSEFLNNVLKYERVTVFISRVVADDYPVVRAYLNVNGKKDGVEELANDFEVGDFTFTDNGYEISPQKVIRITDDTNNNISIALVIDGSGSMSGDRIENARRAVEACIDNMNPATQELSIVMYDDSIENLSSLTNDAAALRAGAGNIVADGGTDIPIGLMAGIESLKNAIGTKAIILMTDGEDGNADQMPAAIEAAREENIAVFTVSTGGGNREYMENIAMSTGGSYMEALTSSDLVKVYTTLQNYIVNNYCFEYTVEEGTETNPRMAVIGLADYGTSSTRTYAYGGLIMAKDGSYITSRAESGELQLFAADPAVVSAADAGLGVPIFLSASGVTEGAEVLINRQEVGDVRIVGDSVIAFVLEGDYAPGTLNVTVRLPDGTSRSTENLLSVAESGEGNTGGRTILLGQSGNTLYGDKVEQVNEYKLKLSGNVVLNGFVRTSSAVTVQSNTPITFGDGNLILSGGTVQGSGEAYIDFSVPADSVSDYGPSAYGGGSAKVLDYFGFYFDATSIQVYNSAVTLKLPGFGEVYANAEFDGKEFQYTVSGGYQLQELQDNLNFAFNGIPLPQKGVDSAIQMITGYAPPVWGSSYSGYGFHVQAENLTITVGRDSAQVRGTGTVYGEMGLIEIADGSLTIDTTEPDKMFEISGTAKFDNLHPLVAAEDVPFLIQGSGWYPDSLTIHGTGFSVDASGMSECFLDGVPRPLEGTVTLRYALGLSEEPYRNQVTELVTDLTVTCDRIIFICTNDRSKNGFAAYDSEHPELVVKVTGAGLVIPINDVDELSLFGSSLGGQITGEALIGEQQIVISLDVDGHLDNTYYNIRHDGRANLTIWLPRGASAESTIPVTVDCGEENWEYHAATTGGIVPEDGFHTYAEDNGE